MGRLSWRGRVDGGDGMPLDRGRRTSLRGMIDRTLLDRRRLELARLDVALLISEAVLVALAQVAEVDDRS